MDTAGEFIYTASLLIHIKSKMLLPRAPSGPEDAAEDPRRELVERLLEHERFKNAAQMLLEKQMLEAATWTNPGVREFKEDASAEPEIAADTVDLVRVFRDILDRARNRPILNVQEDSVTVGQMIQFLARRLTMEDKPVALRRLLSHTQSERALRLPCFLHCLRLKVRLAGNSAQTRIGISAKSSSRSTLALKRRWIRVWRTHATIGGRRSRHPQENFQWQEGQKGRWCRLACTLTVMNFFPRKLMQATLATALAGLLPGAGFVPLCAQEAAQTTESELAQVPLPEPSANALPLPEDRGAADLEQTLKRLGTTGSVLVIVAHPDDEDGALMTYLSRGLGVRVTLMTLTRGEGGQNAMSAETYDALGLIRTQELLKADEYYGAQELWGTEADFGFSKTQEEAFKQWGHDRVLYDAVLAVRMVRPQVILSTFIGGVSDGHGQHQVSGEIAQEAFKAASDPKVFPEQLKDGLQPWQPLAVYSRAPFARIANGQTFDYATGKLAPAKFHNYVTDEWITGSLPSDVTLPTGTWDPTLGRTYVQIAREGWGEQKSQYGGANPALSEPDTTGYHLWAAVPAAATTNSGADSASLFENRKVNIDTSIAGLARLVNGNPPAWLGDGLREIETGLNAFEKECTGECGVEGAHKLAPVYRKTLDLYARVKASDLDAEAKAGLELELEAKIEQFQAALKDLLGLDLIAFKSGSSGGQGGSGRGGTADETARSVAPGEAFGVRVHASQLLGATRLNRVWLESTDRAAWKIDDAGGADRRWRVCEQPDFSTCEPQMTHSHLSHSSLGRAPSNLTTTFQIKRGAIGLLRRIR